MTIDPSVLADPHARARMAARNVASSPCPVP